MLTLCICKVENIALKFLNYCLHLGNANARNNQK